MIQSDFIVAKDTRSSVDRPKIDGEVVDDEKGMEKCSVDADHDLALIQELSIVNSYQNQDGNLSVTKNSNVNECLMNDELKENVVDETLGMQKDGVFKSWNGLFTKN